ncbi:MAG TPA: FAD-dependent monooxygenase [Mycobacteriales bacterium]|nr:FAD-dependent monooxygenase [Mycobacteriales bacterium]
MADTVIVVGAGPTGLALAIELATAGVDTVVVEQRSGRRPDSPGLALNAGSVELLDQRGLMDALRPDTIPLPGTHFSLLPLDMSRVSPRFQDSVLIAQSRLERYLERRAVDRGVEVRRGQQVVGLDQDNDGVTVTVGTPEGVHQHRCRFVVGCDGADSTVRTLGGFGFTGTRWPFYGLVAELDVDLANLAPEHTGAYYSPTGNGVYMCVPLGPSLVRVVTAEFAPGPAELDTPVTVDGFRTTVERLTGTPMARVGLRWLNRYDNRTGQAHAYRRGNVFLAGEAAHIVFPLNGQAIHTGLHDGMNLGWKLAAEVRGQAPAGLLDTYHAERHPVGRRACMNVRAQVAIAGRLDLVGDLREMFAELIGLDEANRYLVETVTGTDVRYPMPGDHPLLGRRLPPTPLKTANGDSSVSRVLSPGRGVLLDWSGQADLLADVSAWADRVDVVGVRPTPEVDVAALLLRPDGHVAWVGVGGSADRHSLRAALSTWFGDPPSG